MWRSILAVTLVAVAAACGGSDNDDSTNTNGNNNNNGSGQPQGTLSDAQILAITGALNQGEINEANAVLPKIQNSDVKDFGNRMVSDHTAFLAEESAIKSDTNIDPQENGVSNQLKAQSGQQVATLSATPAGPALDRAYMQGQVDGHQAALTMIDTQLLPNVSDAGLNDYLSRLHDGVQAHLSSGRSILAGLPSQ